MRIETTDQSIPRCTISSTKNNDAPESTRASVISKERCRTKSRQMCRERAKMRTYVKLFHEASSLQRKELLYKYVSCVLADRGAEVCRNMYLVDSSVATRNFSVWLAAHEERVVLTLRVVQAS